MTQHFIGIDVGTGSARAGVFDPRGRMLASAKREIATYRATGGIAEQSGDQIWNALCAASREAVDAAEIAADTVSGIGFDATCSLVVRGADGGPVAVGGVEYPERDIILWMDHRAVAQADYINRTGHDVLRYVGGAISPEMETPKLLWLKQNRPEAYGAAKNFFDLTDFLTWRATGSLARSACTVTCKWTYLAHERRWDESYFREIGLGDLVDDGFARIGREVVDPGTKLGMGLTSAAAAELGLTPGTPVAAGLIDAHAGGLGTVGASGGAEDPTKCLAYVFGTSSCTMTTTREPAFVPGVWGPYHSAMIPGMWLNEGGQSAAGAAIDHLVTLHPAHTEAVAQAAKDGMSLPHWLAEAALSASRTTSEAVALAGDLHVVPEFLGNRAPFADPNARAVIAGQGMEAGVDALLALYIAGICGLGYGLRQIVAAQTQHGAAVERIAISGGAGRHPLIRQILADATGLPVEATDCQEPVLLGSAMLGAVAAGAFPDPTSAMSAMSRVEAVYAPATGWIRSWHDKRYDAFLKLQHVAREIRSAPEEL